MLREKTVTIVVNNTTQKWYKARGYKIPTHTVQLWTMNKNGDGFS